MDKNYKKLDNDKNLIIMDKTSEISSSIPKVEDRLVDGVAGVADKLNIVSDNLTKDMDETFSDVKLDLKNNREKIDEFQNTVAALNKTVAGLEDDMT